jgi:hypothetical protein
MEGRMRAAIFSLITAAGLAATAQAQEPAATPPAAVASTPAGQPAPASPPADQSAPAPAAAAPPASDPATAPAGGPAVSPQAPAGSTQAAPQPSAAANPTLPTEGDGAAVLSILQRICVPAVQGQNLDSLAKAAGLKKDKRSGGWVSSLGADRNYNITVQPQGSNKNVCQAEIRYAVGQEKPIVNALNVWAFLHQPEMPLQRNDFVNGEDGVKRITLSWEYYTDKESTGLVLVQQKKTDGSPLNPKFDTATMLYSERKF